MFLNNDPLHWTTMNATNALFIFTAISYMTSLFGGWLADTFLGKFPTLVLFFIVYIGGYAFMPLFYPYPVEPGKALAEHRGGHADTAAAGTSCTTGPFAHPATGSTRGCCSAP